MVKVFGKKLDWKHVVIFVLVIVLVYFIYEHHGIKGAYDALKIDVGMAHYNKNKRVKIDKEKHPGEICDNNKDDNNDGLTDCEDPKCNSDERFKQKCSIQKQVQARNRRAHNKPNKPNIHTPTKYEVLSPTRDQSDKDKLKGISKSITDAETNYRENKTQANRDAVKRAKDYKTRWCKTRGNLCHPHT